MIRKLYGPDLRNNDFCFHIIIDKVSHGIVIGNSNY